MYVTTMKSNTKRIVVVLLIATMLITSAMSLNWVKAEETGALPATRTKEEIIQYFQDYPSYIYTGWRSNDMVYKETPSVTSPYKAGTLNDSVYTEFLNAVNEIRFAAGLNPVTLNENYNQAAQAASLVNAVNGFICHYPNQPSGMDKSLYDLGYYGASHSNLASGYNGPAATVYLGWIDDSDSSNIETLGHRRWILDPNMKQTGYGEVYNFATMYAFDGANYSKRYTGVAWPARLMPMSMFWEDFVWSYSLGRELSDTEIEALKVTIKDDHSGKQWVVSKDQGELYVNNGNYGLPGAIIFRPVDFGDPGDGESFTVTISGLQSGELSYNVEFFDAKDNPQPVTPDEPEPATPDEPEPVTPDEPTPVTPDEPTPATPEDPTPGEPVPSDPDKEEPVTPDVVLNGLVRGEDGKLAYYYNGEVLTSVTGLVQNSAGFWYVENGYVDETRNDIVPDDGGVWWKISNGLVDFDYTGVAKNKYGWWRVENGYVNFNANGIYKNDYGWWKVEDGKVNFNYTGVAKNDYGWWRVEKGKVNFKANGVFKNEYGWWKVEKGKVNFNYTGVAKNDYGWWRIEKGKVNFKFNGIAKNEYGTWYLEKGKVNFKFSGKVKYNGKTYRVTEGKAKLA